MAKKIQIMVGEKEAEELIKQGFHSSISMKLLGKLEKAVKKAYPATIEGEKREQEIMTLAMKDPEIIASVEEYKRLRTSASTMEDEAYRAQLTARDAAEKFLKEHAEEFQCVYSRGYVSYNGRTLHEVSPWSIFHKLT